MKKILKKYRLQYKLWKRLLADDTFFETMEINRKELEKASNRTEIINFFCEYIQAEKYLEIGVRNPNDNFNLIQCKEKTSVDPGVEYLENPVDYKMTSDEFFKYLNTINTEIENGICFDIIFIDGLHLANQVDRDIQNSLSFLSDKGVVILHDCNPPTEFHQRENFKFINTPARGFWNGTTWKAFYKYRHHNKLYSLCFDTDYGVGIISKKYYPLFNNINTDFDNPFFEFHKFEQNRDVYLNLKSFEEWKKSLK